MMIIHLVDRKRIDAWILGRGCKEKFFAENEALRKNNLTDLIPPRKEKFILTQIKSESWITHECELSDANEWTKIQNIFKFNLILIEIFSCKYKIYLRLIWYLLRRDIFVQMWYIFFSPSRQRFSTPVNRRSSRALCDLAEANAKPRESGHNLEETETRLGSSLTAFTELKIRPAIRFGERSEKYTASNLLGVFLPPNLYENRI